MTDQPSARKSSVHVAFSQSRLERLKRRADFLRVAGTRQKWATHGLILQIAPVKHTPVKHTPVKQPPTKQTETPAPEGHQSPRVGFTASKKVGGAVVRNRAKRRLRAVADEILPVEASRHCDYVLIGRPETVDRPFDALKGDLRYALRKLNVAGADAPAPISKSKTPSQAKTGQQHQKKGNS